MFNVAMSDIRRGLMDVWNPWIDETYVKRVPFWQAALWLVGGVFITLSVIFGITVMLFSLEKIT